MNLFLIVIIKAFLNVDFIYLYYFPKNLVTDSQLSIFQYIAKFCSKCAQKTKKKLLSLVGQTTKNTMFEKETFGDKMVH